VDVRALDLIWLRRINYPQVLPGVIEDPVQVELINNDCRASILGLIACEFDGRWVNDPFASYRAENKIIQLKMARAVGLRTPRTLVSQNPERVRKFCEELDFEVILKTVKGSSKHPLFTVKVDEELMANEASIRIAPAMYQELVPGVEHLRVHCFGSSVYSFSVQSDELDWRGNIDVPIAPTELDAGTRDKLLELLRILNLRMGVFDLKRRPDGELVWLEVNPQGQFLFLEGLTGERLSLAFADFLHSELA
jgi:glutathione synthase/RimK-type ligase-like ATP-grasp enzyme